MTSALGELLLWIYGAMDINRKYELFGPLIKCVEICARKVGG